MSDDADLDAQHLAAENERLRAELASAAGAKVSKRRVRRTTAAVLAFVTALLMVLTVVAGWTSRTALNTDKFVDRVGPIIDQPEVRTAIAVELTAELTKAIDTQSRLQKALPDNLTFLAGPISSGVDNVIGKQVTKVVDSKAFSRIWYASLRLSHTQVVRLLTGKDANVQIVRGKVVVNLIGVVEQVLSQLQSQLPTVFGTAISLQIPDNLPLDQIRALVSRYLGIDLPPDFALVPIFDAAALQDAQTGVKVINLSIVLLLVLTVGLFVLTLVASTDRRRTLLQVGLWTALITALVFFAVRGLTQSSLSGIQNDTLEPAAKAAVREVFSSLRGWAALLFWCGTILALAMYLAGPGRLPRTLRGWVSRGTAWTVARGRAVAEDEGVAAWVAGNIDPLRVGGAILAAVLLLVFSSWTALLVVGILLVLYEVGITLWARSTPAAPQEAT